MNLKQLAHDKALHVIGGSLVGATAATASAMLGRPAWQAAAAGGAALLAGVLVERWQARANEKALADGQPLPHTIERADIAFTAIGGVIVGAPSLVPLLIRLLS